MKYKGQCLNSSHSILEWIKEIASEGSILADPTFSRVGSRPAVYLHLKKNKLSKLKGWPRPL